MENRRMQYDLSLLFAKADIFLYKFQTSQYTQHSVINHFNASKHFMGEVNMSQCLTTMVCLSPIVNHTFTAM